MKRLLTLFALLALTLSACGAQAAPAMYIEPAKLTEEEESIAKLLGADTDQFLLDVVLDSTVRSFHVRYYDLDDGGQWHVFSESRMALDGSGTKGRMAFTYGDLSKGTREAVQFGKGVSAVSHTPPPEEDAASPNGGKWSMKRRFPWCFRSSRRKTGPFYMTWTTFSSPRPTRIWAMSTSTP